MTVEEYIQDLLAADETLVELVPASRIRLAGEYQNLDRPYIIHFPVSDTPINTHSGLAALRIWDRYRVSVFADDYSTGRAVAEVVRSLLGAQRTTVSCFFLGQVYIHENQTGIHHFALDFRVAEALI